MHQNYKNSLIKFRDAEVGYEAKFSADLEVALVYPSPYRIAAASLGFHSIVKVVNQLEFACAHRAALPESDELDVLRCLESLRPVSDYDAIGYSVAYEMELSGIIKTLRLCGLPTLSKDRPESAPLVFAGGPLTFSNPAPIGPFFDVICLGEGEDLVGQLLQTYENCGRDRKKTINLLAESPGFYVPSLHGDNVPAIARADERHVPAQSQFTTPYSELSNMHLTEAVRGCSRGCNYCVMRRSTNGGMRLGLPEKVLASIPDHATRVGLVGASVTDHPQIAEIVEAVVASGREVGISSLRADKLTERLVAGLAAGGYRTLTVAADGASQKLRFSMDRRTNDGHLIQSAKLAKAFGLKTLKVYMMVGLPEETDADFDELTSLIQKLHQHHPRIALGVSPFVAKRHTPLDGQPYAGIDVVNRRLKIMRKNLKGMAEIRPTSARWAWVEYMLAQGTQASGLAVIEAEKNGGNFAAYKKAFSNEACRPTGPIAKVPSSSERATAQRLKVIRSS